eukprot:m.169538 g.169538  ORF g.169538 m.169538 type:complete len:374 (-) comp17807_c1_seq4:51-1172(-)
MMSFECVPFELPSSRRACSFGATVHGVDLSDERIDDDKQFVRAMTAQLHRHKLLVFRKQGRLSGERQVAISRWFGELHSTFYKHPKSPHPDIFRVSNDPRQGCINVGRAGWHIDGSFLPAPFKLQTMHFWHASRGGVTEFASFSDLLQDVPQSKRDFWRRLTFISADGICNPLVWLHPVTREECMVFHCGRSFMRGLAIDVGTEAQRELSEEETEQVILDLEQQLSTRSYKMVRPGLAVRWRMIPWGKKRNNKHRAVNTDSIHNGAHTQTSQQGGARHQKRTPSPFLQAWEDGDFALVDNLALAHFATPETQLRPDEVGLRILHRTTVHGDGQPATAARPWVEQVEHHEHNTEGEHSGRTCRSTSGTAGGALS